MNVLKLGLVSAVMMVTTGGAALAADMYDRDYRGSLKDSLYEGEAVSDRQWYWRLDLGYGFNSDPDLEDSNKVDIVTDDYDDGLVLGGGIGFNLMRGFRIDATLDYRFENELSGYYPAAGPANQTSADVDTLLGLVNFYYDLDMGHRITPYVGVGVGFADHDVDGADFAGGGDTNFAWALMAGVAVDLKDRWKLDVGYRYLNMGELKVGIKESEKATKFATADFVETDDLESHEIRVGLRYSFSCFVRCAEAAPEYESYK